ncbi:arylesterase [Sulfurivermis fontis]|uniref:arylesterase n=1 Tax=Sulfurivermis fontis TaxID=1972068 RepID=UPI000FD945C6|nr:arylesterase [Sulfurivermis fontis]
MRNFLLAILLFIVACHAQAGTVLVLGDSLSAGYGLTAGEGWVALLQQRLEQRGLEHTVVNASISGDTTAGGLARLDAVLDQHRPDWLLLELGANDGLRGLSLKAMRDNLDAMVMRAQARGIKVVLIGMQIPPNYGRVYTERFAAVYQELAARHRLPFVPFLMEKVALDPALIQADQLHPNAAAQPLLLDTVWPVLEPLLR